jgi:hypothetical protein
MKKILDKQYKKVLISPLLILGKSEWISSCHLPALHSLSTTNPTSNLGITPEKYLQLECKVNKAFISWVKQTFHFVLWNWSTEVSNLKFILRHTPQLNAAMRCREEKQLWGVGAQWVHYIPPVMCESGGDCPLHQVPTPDVSIYAAR